MIETTYQAVVDCVKDMVSHDLLYFDAVLQIKLSLHTEPLNIWAVGVSPKDEIYLMDAFEAWNLLEAKDINAEIVLRSLYHRVKALRRQYIKGAVKIIQSE